MNKIPTKGDVINISLDPSLGHEQKGFRPALVLTDKIYTEKSDLIICLPLTTSIKEYPFEVVVEFKDKKGVVLVDQIKTLDIVARKYKILGQISKEKMIEIDLLLKTLLAL
jgi:mRNA interferase MazF